MIRAGSGFIEKRYWLGCCQDSFLSELACEATTPLLRSSRTFVDSMHIPN
jgi:hypothetical protein